MPIIGTKVPSQTSVSPGGTISYVITITNTSDATVSPVTFTDTLPTGVTYVSLTPSPSNTAFTGSSAPTITPLAPGGTGTFTIAFATFPAGPVTYIATLVVAVHPGTAANTPILNIATITFTGDSSPFTITSDPVTVGAAVSALSVTKTGPNRTRTDKRITYLITLNNAGPSTASNVVLTDTLSFRPGRKTFLTQLTNLTSPFTITPTANSRIFTAVITSLAAGSTIFALVVRAPKCPGCITNTVCVATATTGGATFGSTIAAVTTCVEERKEKKKKEIKSSFKVLKCDEESAKKEGKGGKSGKGKKEKDCKDECEEEKPVYY